MNLKKIWVTSLTETSTTNKEGLLGQLRVEADGKVYRYVQNKHTAALSVGDSVVGAGTDPLQGFAYRMGAAGTATGFLLGVAIVALPVDSFGWVQCFGYNATISVEGTVDILLGDSLVPAANQLYLVKSSATTAPPGAHVVAAAGYTPNSVGTIPGFIKAL